MYFFQGSVHFCIENAKFRPIFANLGYFVANLRTFGALFTGLNTAAVPKNWKISGPLCTWFILILKWDAGKVFEKSWWPRKVAKLTTAKFSWNSYISWSRLVFDNKGRKLLNISFNFQLFALMIKDVSQMNACFWEDFELIMLANI